MQYRSLSAFRRFVSEPGARIQLTRHDALEASGQTAEIAPEYWNPLPVASFDEQGCTFIVEGLPTGVRWRWADLSRFRFDGQKVSYDLGKDRRFRLIAEARCWAEP